MKHWYFVRAPGDCDGIPRRPATVIDLSDVKGDDPANHDKFAQLATVAPELRAVLERGISANNGAATADEVVSLPSTLLGGPIRISTGQ